MPNIFQDISKKISDDITVDSNKKIQFRDTGLFIQSNADGQITISSDGSGTADVRLSGSLELSQGIKYQSNAYTSASAIDVNDTLVLLTPGTSTVAYSYAAPVPGHKVYFHKTDATGTANVQLTAGTWDGTNGTARFTGQYQTLEVIGVSATRFMILNRASAATGTAHIVA